MEASDTKEHGVQSHIEDIEKAIELGNFEEASKLLSSLKGLNLQLPVQHKHTEPAGEGGDTVTDDQRPNIRVKVYFEDKEGSAGFTVMRLLPSASIKSLKEKVFIDYGFPRDIQRLIIGKHLPSDDDTLASQGVIDGSSVFLYLLSAQTIGLSKQTFITNYSDTVPSVKYGPSMKYQKSTLTVEPEAAVATVMNVVQMQAPAATTATPVGSAHHTPHVVAPKVVVAPKPVTPPTPEPDPGWSCPTCTYINIPTRPGCEQCSEARPNDYKVPAGTLIPVAEKQRLAGVQQQELLLKQCEREEFGSPQNLFHNVHTNLGLREQEPPDSDERLGISVIDEQELLLQSFSSLDSGGFHVAEESE